MADSSNAVDLSEIDWSQCANFRPPDLKKLGDSLSSNELVGGPCWETVADALNYDNQKRRDIKLAAQTNKITEGYALLYHWTSWNNTAHSLQVLKSALECCERQDIMDILVEAIHNMHKVTLHVVVALPSNAPDPDTRPHRLKVVVNASDTLANALRPHIDNVQDYEISDPKGATWRSQATNLKGEQITIIRKYQDETNIKTISSGLQETDIQGEWNISPNESVKVLNWSQEMSVPASGCESTDSNNPPIFFGSLNISPTFEEQNRFQSTETAETLIKDTHKRKIPEEQSDESSDDGNEDNKPSLRKHELMTEHVTCRKCLPNPPEKWRRLKSKIFIPRASESFDTAGLPYWHSQITTEEMERRMTPYLNQDGCYIVWRYEGAAEHDNKLVISVSHEGQLLHYNIRARVFNRSIRYYLFKKVYNTENVLHLVDYYTRNCLECRSRVGNGRDIKLRIPVPKRLPAQRLHSNKRPSISFE